MSRGNFFSGSPWDGSRPTARMAGAPRPPRPRLGSIQNGCIVPGTQERPVFQLNPTTKACGVFTMDTSTAAYPDCVKAPEGYYGGGYNGWIPPSCMPAGAPAGGAPSSLPPGFACPTGGGKYTIVDYRTGEIIAENVIQEDWSKYVSDMTVLPPGRTCDDDPRCKPICGTPTPPPTTPTTPTTPTPPPTTPSDSYPSADQCPAGQQWNGSACEAIPAPAPEPEPTTAISPAATQVSPGASVPIVPRPFPTVPMQAPVPISQRVGPSMAPPPVPQKEFSPSQRPACKTVPYKARIFPGATVPTRPDAFGNAQQWTS